MDFGKIGCLNFFSSSVSVHCFCLVLWEFELETIDYLQVNLFPNIITILVSQVRVMRAPIICPFL